MTITRRIFLAGSASLVVVGCDDDKTPQAPQAPRPPTPSSSQWHFLNSPGLSAVVIDASGMPYFEFPPSGSAHMLMRATGALRGLVRVRYRFDGGPVKPVQGLNATVSLMFQRSGDNWSGGGPYESYRWYHSGAPLSAGEHMLEAQLTEAHWHNVMGRNDPQGFEAAKANAALVGLAFGDPGAGATAHGVSGTGRFTVLEFVAQ